MFWSKQKAGEVGDNTSEGVGEKVANEAEGLYRSGKMHCAEAVLAAVKNNFAAAVPDDVVRLVAGFGGGSGSGPGGRIVRTDVIAAEKAGIMKMTGFFLQPRRFTFKRQLLTRRRTKSRRF